MSTIGASRTANRVKGFSNLAVLAILGWGLASLSRVERRSFAVLTIPGDRGETFIAIVEGIFGRPGGSPEVRLVLSKVPVIADAARRVLIFPDKGRRIVPPGWSTVLIDRDGRMEPYPLALSAAEAPVLLRARTFADARRALIGIDRRLNPFFER